MRWQKYIRGCWHRARHHWAAIALAALLSAYSLVTTFEPEVAGLPGWMNTQRWPKVPLPWVAVCAALAFAFILLEGGSRWHVEALKSAEAREAELERCWEADRVRLQWELATEKHKRGRPDVIVTCEWPSAAGGSRLTELLKRNLTVALLNEHPAMNVKIQDIVLEGGKASFDLVPVLRKDKAEQVLATIEKPNGNAISTSPAWNFESLIVVSYGDKLTELDLKAPPIRVVARYGDFDGRVWESVNELTYDLFLQKGEMRHIEIRGVSS